MPEQDVVHRGSLRISAAAFLLFSILALAAGMVRDDRPTPLVLLVGLGTWTFIQGYVLQRVLTASPDGTLLNVPQKKRFVQLPARARLPILRRANRMIGLVNTFSTLVFSVILIQAHLAPHVPWVPSQALGSRALWTVVIVSILVVTAEVVGLRRMVLDASPDPRKPGTGLTPPTPPG